MINLNFHYNSSNVSHESGLRTQVNKHEFKSKTVYRKFFTSIGLQAILRWI